MWKEIPSFPGYYANEHGRILGRRGKILEQRLSDNGYPQVRMCYNYVPYERKVHKLVIEAFHGPRPKGYDVHHKNTDKTDNRPQNLKYITRAENIKKTYDNGREHPRGNGKLTWEIADEIRSKRALGFKTETIAAEYGVHRMQVSRIYLGQTWKKEARSCRMARKCP